MNLNSFPTFAIGLLAGIYLARLTRDPVALAHDVLRKRIMEIELTNADFRREMDKSQER